MAEYIHAWRRRETNKFALEFEVFVFVGRDVHVTEQRALSLVSVQHRSRHLVCSLNMCVSLSHTHIRTHTHVHIHTDAHTHTQIRTHKQTHTHTHITKNA